MYNIVYVSPLQVKNKPHDSVTNGHLFLGLLAWLQTVLLILSIRPSLVYIYMCKGTTSPDTGFSFRVYKIKSVLTIGLLMDIVFFYPSYWLIKNYFKIATVI
jgi:hypothetical protein